MKNINLLVLAILSLLFQNLVTAQDDSPPTVESSMFEVHLTFIGGNVVYEAGLTDALAFRAEVGMNLSFQSNVLTDGTELYGSPTFNLEPRWYYNLEKRQAEGKPYTKNAGNFAALSLYHLSNIFELGSDNASLVPSIHILPKWGMRRVYGERVVFELAVATGPRYVMYNSVNDLFDNDWELDLQLHLRLGYTF